MSSVLYIPSQGSWHATVTTAGRTLIRPGATMRLGLVVRAVSLSEVEEGITSNAHKSRLVLGGGGGHTSNEGSQRATVAVLGPMDSALTHIMLYQGQTYTFEIIGGDVTMHIEGKFEPFLPNNTPVEDTVILQVEATD